jgi:DNA repair protein RadA/Sms
VNLWDQDIFLNVVGRLEVVEPAADLAIVAAILSSLFNRPLSASTRCSEKWAGGEIRLAIFPAVRLKVMLGF